MKNVSVNGKLIVGKKRFGKSKKETLLFVEDIAVLNINGDVSIGYGSDIEVFLRREWKHIQGGEGTGKVKVSRDFY